MARLFRRPNYRCHQYRYRRLRHGPEVCLQRPSSQQTGNQTSLSSFCRRRDFDRITSVLDPFSTLIVISSKSFKTQETRANTQEILDWLKKAGIPEKDFKHHVVVVSAKPDAAEQFGLPKENFFPIWDWVGGRFSVWGAIGLPVAIALGAGHIQALPGRRSCDGPARLDRSAAEQPAGAHGNVRLLEL